MTEVAQLGWAEQEAVVRRRPTAAKPVRATGVRRYRFLAHSRRALRAVLDG